MFLPKGVESNFSVGGSVLRTINWVIIRDSVIGGRMLLVWGSDAGFSEKRECPIKTILAIYKDF